MHDILRLESISFSYSDSKKVLNNLYLAIDTNSTVAVIGRNGCGKTTLFNCLTLENRFSGSVFINDMYCENSAKNKFISLMSQSSFLPKNLIVSNLLKFMNIDSSFIDGDKNINKVLNKKIFMLSEGERRYLEFVLVILDQKPIVILDEPFSQIEPKIIEIMIEIIRIQSKTKLVIVSDHNIDYIKKVSDFIYIMINGSLHLVKEDESLAKYGYTQSV